MDGGIVVYAWVAVCVAILLFSFYQWIKPIKGISTYDRVFRILSKRKEPEPEQHEEEEEEEGEYESSSTISIFVQVSLFLGVSAIMFSTFNSVPSTTSATMGIGAYANVTTPESIAVASAVEAFTKVTSLFPVVALAVMVITILGLVLGVYGRIGYNSGYEPSKPEKKVKTYNHKIKGKSTYEKARVSYAKRRGKKHNDTSYY